VCERDVDMLLPEPRRQLGDLRSAAHRLGERRRDVDERRRYGRVGLIDRFDLRRPERIAVGIEHQRL
jgi:hypothetical protein